MIAEKGTDVDFLRSKNIKADAHDPYWHPNEAALNKKYDIVLCTYVLNVVDEPTRKSIIKRLKDLTKSNGKVYITVRRDIKKHTVSQKGTPPI